MILFNDDKYWFLMILFNDDKYWLLISFCFLDEDT